MLNDVSNVPFDRIYYYTLDIHNFFVLDDTTYDAKNNDKTDLMNTITSLTHLLLI